MAENLECKKKSNPEDEELQKTFSSLLASNIKSSFGRYGYLGRYGYPINEVRARFSTKFLRENKDWLK